MFAKLNSGHGTGWFLDHINYVDDAVSSLQYSFQSGSDQLDQRPSGPRLLGPKF